MRAFKVLNNQSGMMAMMGAMIFTIAITITLSTFYVYTINQAKYHARIKEAYQLINIMESFATASRKAYDMGMSAAGTPSGRCPDSNGNPGAGPLPQPIANTNPQGYFCQPIGETCFRRADTGEEYCSVISFTANVEIKRKVMYAETSPDRFIKSWRRGLNNFFISPNIKDRVVDTSTMAYMMKKPMLLDWLVSTAHAAREQGGELPTSAPSPTPGTAASYVDCVNNRICLSAEAGQTLPGDGGGPLTGCGRPLEAHERAKYCTNCATNNQFCPSAGSPDSRNGAIRVRGSDGHENFLPVSQKFSIVM